MAPNPNPQLQECGLELRKGCSRVRSQIWTVDVESNMDSTLYLTPYSGSIDSTTPHSTRSTPHWLPMSHSIPHSTPNSILDSTPDHPTSTPHFSQLESTLQQLGTIFSCHVQLKYETIYHLDYFMLSPHHFISYQHNSVLILCKNKPIYTLTNKFYAELILHKRFFWCF